MLPAGPGRPPLAEADRSRTRLVRLALDLADKLAEVTEVEATTAADVLDPLVRAEIENRHRVNLPAIKMLRAARERAAKARAEADAPEMQNTLGGEG